MSKEKKKQKGTPRPNNGGHNATLFTDEDIRKIEAMAANGLSVKQISQIFGIHKRTFERNKHRIAAIGAAHEAGRNKAANNVGKSLYQEAITGNTNAIKLYYGYALGRWEKRESVHTGDHEGGPIQQRIVMEVRDYTADDEQEDE